MVMKIRWLHISDIHLNATGTETRRMRTQLIDFLKAAKVSYDYLFVTGDLRYAPKGSFDPDTFSFLTELMNSIHVCKKNVFIIPGNHDVDRENDERKIHIASIWDNFESYYNPKEGIIKEEDLMAIASGQEKFNEIIENFYQDVPDRMEKYKNCLHPHFNIVTDNINVLHVNSTLLYAEEHQKDLIIGTYHLMDALMEIDKSKPTILLTHYSFDFFNRNEQKEILRLLTDYNIQLWLAGHEHDEMLRKQNDYFYEFQAGNVLYEVDDANSCILIGEMDTEKGEGIVQGLEWHTDLGWKLSENISRQSDKSRYFFELQDDEAMQTAMVLGANSDDFATIAKEPYAFDMYAIENDKKEYDDPYAITVVPGLQGEELSIFLGRGQEDFYKGFIYLDGNFAPFMEVDVIQSHYDTCDSYLMKNDTMEIQAIKLNGIVKCISYQYNFSKYNDVDMRLFHFNKIKEYISSCNVFVKMVGHEGDNLNYKTELDTDEWKDNLEITEYWIQQMKKISKIENYYGIKFYLPAKATDEEYLAIEVLSDSIDGKPCRILPPMSLACQLFRKKYFLKEEIDIEGTDRLLRLSLFGYLFQPERQYIIPGEYFWNKKQKGWESKKEGGVPVCVKFKVSYEEDKNRELISYIPFEEYQDEFDTEYIPELTGDLEMFFEEYAEITYGIQQNRQHFLNYTDSLCAFGVEDTENTKRERQFSQRFHDKVTVNRLTDNALSAGRKMVQGIDALVLKYGKQDEFSSTVGNDNLAYLWMIVMNEYSVKGHFPISLSKSGEAYYDLQMLREESKREENAELVDFIDVFETEILENKTFILNHYEMIRNYAYTVAVIQKKYYEVMESIIKDYVETMNDIIEKNPELVHKGKKFSNHIVYTLEKDPTNMHIFGSDEEVMGDFIRFKNEAEKYYNMQKIGMCNIEEL